MTAYPEVSAPSIREKPNFRVSDIRTESNLALPRTPFGTNYEVAGAGGIDLSFVRVPTTRPEVR
jgi:hypothetical protein